MPHDVGVVRRARKLQLSLEIPLLRLGVHVHLPNQSQVLLIASPDSASCDKHYFSLHHILISQTNPPFKAVEAEGCDCTAARRLPTFFRATSGHRSAVAGSRACAA